MKYYLSIDSGGTKTAFLIVNEKGQEVINFNLGPANYLVNGLDNVIDIYQDGLNIIEKQTKITQKDITNAFIAMAGYGDIPEDEAMINDKLKEVFSFKLKVGNDTENALSGSLVGESGIHIIAGTGSIAIGKDLNDNIYRSGGWHHAFGGDEGSGYWIGSRLIQHFTKQADGREEKTYLYDYIMKKYQLSYPENILDLVVNKWGCERDKIASLSKDTSICADNGDYVAYAIFTKAAKELAMIVNAVHTKGKYDNVTKVSYSGGVFKRFDLFEKTFINYLNFRNEIVTPKYGPLIGGIILAMKQDNIKINQDILSNLKIIDSKL